MKTPSSTFVPNISRLQSFDYESIVQTLITRTDTIWLQALAMDTNSGQVIRNLKQLLDAGLIKLWDYEIPLSKSIHFPSRVITIEEYNEIEMYKNMFAQEAARNTPELRSSDYTIFNIERKNIFGNQLLAECCEATSILQRLPYMGVPRGTGKETASNIYAELYAPYLFGKTSISNLSELTVEEIIKLRKLSVHFRKKIMKCVEQYNFTQVPDELIKRDCEKLHREYEKRIQEAIADKYGTPGKGAALDLFSLFISWTSIFTVPAKIIDSFVHRHDRGFVMYMTTLNEAGKRAGGK